MFRPPNKIGALTPFDFDAHNLTDLFHELHIICAYVVFLT